MTQVGLGASATNTADLKIDYGYGTATENNGSLKDQKIAFSGYSGEIVQSYTYDNLNRIKSSKETHAAGTQSWKETFNYDRFGNRIFDAANTTTISGCPQAVCNPTISESNNRINSGQGYSYDKAGNVTQDAESQRFEYDAENHQIRFYKAGNSGSTPDAEYHYDGDGKRVRKIDSGKETLFVYNAAGSLIAEYETDYTPPATATTKYLTQDHLGSPRAITDQTGAIVSRHDYRAFGEEVLSGTAFRTSSMGYGETDAVRQQYTGYERDNESGLDFAQARYYSSKLGRFTSVDPMTASANVKDPQTFNRYSYAMNSPYKFSDPLGLLPIKDCPPTCPTIKITNPCNIGEIGCEPVRLGTVDINASDDPNQITEVSVSDDSDKICGVECFITTGLASLGTVVLIADDVTGIGVADDFLIPILWGIAGATTAVTINVNPIATAPAIPIYQNRDEQKLIQLVADIYGISYGALSDELHKRKYSVGRGGRDNMTKAQIEAIAREIANIAGEDVDDEDF